MALRWPVLEPDRRQLFLETLRPPDGYRFDCAVGTTFTLDLVALLAVPLAFTFRDAENRDGELTSEPLSLLEGARRHASRISVFCHGGYTAVPRPGQTVLAFLERSVIAAYPPRQPGAGAIFHPKVWVLRYEHRSGGPVRYRLVCQSRNLTFDASWDASLVLDGVLDDGRVRGYSRNRPLADFVRGLPKLALEPISSERRAIVDMLADELRRVRFDAPEGLELSRFLPFGLGRRNPPFPDLAHRPLLIISPFLDGGFLRSAARSRPRTVLVSRREALLKAPAEAIGAFDEVYAFRSGLEPEADDAETELAPLAGLHAKVYVIDDGWNARVAIGSANSTGAALANPPRNVEFMVELVGKKSRFGIDALLGPENEGTAGTFRSLIEPFEIDDAETVDEDEGEQRLERLLDGAAQALARADMRASVETADGDRYVQRLALVEPVELPPEVANVTCWPVTLAARNSRPLEDGAEFPGLRLSELSGFLAIEVRASVAGESRNRRFARAIQLEGLPENRLQRLLAGMLHDREQLMHWLWVLLAPDEVLSVSEIGSAMGGNGESAGWGPAFPGLLERMLDALASDPDRLDTVAALLDDLRSTDAGRELLGTDFDDVWGALWAVRSRRR